MPIDEEGFFYPNIDKNICNNCRLCENVCPVLNPRAVLTKRLHIPLVYAAYNNDHAVRLDSTSGGIFSALAENVFELGGYVGGAVYRNDYSVTHIITNDSSKLAQLRSSKYLQSFTDTLFKDVKELLNDGNMALVCGTPCQIEGLHAFLGKEYVNLFTCDFICRGVNSPKVFQKYMNMHERQQNSNAVKIKFKDKTHGWHRFSMRIDFDNGKTYCKDRYHDLFFIGYLHAGDFARPSCYKCKFKGFNRKSDITLADFWGIEYLDKSMDQDCGTSLVMINTEKGKQLFQNINNKITSKSFSFAEGVKMNPAFHTPMKEGTSIREQFFKDIEKEPFENVAKRYFPKPKIKENKAKTVMHLFTSSGFSLPTWWNLLYYNFLCKNVKSKKFCLYQSKFLNTVV
jgi:coenzyme F420-reducing hydrogenase beta subunit